MKEIILNAYRTERVFGAWLDKKIEEIRKESTSIIRQYSHEDAELNYGKNSLIAGIIRREFRAVKRHIADLRAMYVKYGKKPTEKRSGYYNMLHFLDNVEEAMVITSKLDSWPY